MKRTNLARAAEIEGRIQTLEQAIERCQPSTFKAAFIVVQANAHGVQGTDGRAQQAESRLVLDAALVEQICSSLRHRETEKLRELGVEL